jgi:5-methylcytosine-specific restriction endonuclease McrA
MRIECVCETCGVSFTVIPARAALGRGRFCSRACRRTTVLRQCELCGAEIKIPARQAVQGYGRFCSRSCLAKSRVGTHAAHWQGTAVTRTCKTCKRDFQVEANQIARGRGVYCSRACAETAVERTCASCGTTFKVKPALLATRRFCSLACRYQWQTTLTREHAFNWQGGKSFEPYPLTFNIQFKRLIRQRDNYCCGICGKSGSTHVHHINYVKLDTHPENCITLCVSCHAKTNAHRAFWQALCTEVMILRGWTDARRPCTGQDAPLRRLPHL